MIDLGRSTSWPPGKCYPEPPGLSPEDVAAPQEVAMSIQLEPEPPQPDSSRAKASRLRLSQRMQSVWRDASEADIPAKGKKAFGLRCNVDPKRGLHNKTEESLFHSFVTRSPLRLPGIQCDHLGVSPSVVHWYTCKIAILIGTIIRNYGCSH